MLGMKRIRKNRLRRRQPGRVRAAAAAAMKFLAGGFLMALVSILFVFCYDVVTQCDALVAQKITVGGIERLTREQICKQADIVEGVNIMAVNLGAARKKLMSNPWIAEARIRREMPDGIHIDIVEHRAVAVIDLGRRYLLDENGAIFKELDQSEIDRLPVIQGLRYADIESERPSASESILKGSTPASASAVDTKEGSAFDAVVSVLRLGVSRGNGVAINDIDRIEVDKEIGITLHMRTDPNEIRLGFGDFAVKCDMLKRLLRHLEQSTVAGWDKLETVDLIDPERVVIRPRQDSMTVGETNPESGGKG